MSEHLKFLWGATDTVKTLPITLDKEQGYGLLLALDPGENEVVLTLERKPNKLFTVLEIWIDGDESAHSLHLNPDGTYEVRSHLPI